MGQTLALPDSTDVSLVRESEALAAEAGLFAECQPTESLPRITGKGAYILTLSPAAGYAGQAPMSGLGAAGRITGCGSRFVVEGVAFRLIRLDTLNLDSVSDVGAANLSKLRNWMAHHCYGTERVVDFTHDPFGRVSGAPAFVTYGALDLLRAAGKLTVCDVPLALIYWTNAGIQFTDMWSVRRRITAQLVDQAWPLHIGDRRLAEAEATFLQFQQQLDEAVRRESDLTTVRAVDYFYYLPAAGYLPAGLGQFTRAAFFDGLDIETFELDDAFVRILVHQSLFLEPIDLSAPPPIRVYESPAGPDYVLFVRGERRTEGFVPGADLEEPEAPPPAEPPTPQPQTGSIIADVTLPPDETQEVVVARDVDFQIQAESSLGKTYEPKYVQTDSARLTGSGRTLDRGAKGAARFAFIKGRARFIFESLPPDTYTIIVAARGFKTAKIPVTVRARDQVYVQIKLVRETKPGGKVKPPPYVADAGWILPYWDKFKILPDFVDWKYPPEPDIEWGRWGPLPDPVPEDVMDVLIGIGDDIATRYPDAPIDPGNITIRINPEYNPEVTPDHPYAFVTFGDTGAYVPFVLIASDRNLGVDVPLHKGDIPGIDANLESQFAARGVNDMATLGAAWNGLVRDITGWELDTSSSFISETQARVGELQGGLRIFNGVDAGVEAALNALNVTDALSLANADPQALAAGGAISPGFARRLVEDARRVVPTEAWSITADALGLSAREIAGLQGLGIDSQGKLADLVATAEGRQQAASVFGLGANATEADITAAVETIVNRGDDARAQVRTGRAASAPVSRATGVTEQTAAALGSMGIHTVDQLKNADPDAVTAAFGGDSARASAAIQDASVKVGGALTGAAEIDQNVAQALTDAGVRTMEDLGRADAGAIAAAFGGDSVRAMNAINDARSKVGGRIGRF